MTSIELQNVSVGYGRRVLLEGVTAAADGGRLVALLGRNGTGKARCCVRSQGSKRRLRGKFASADVR